VFYLKRLSSELRRTPKMVDLKGRKMPSSSTYMKRYGSWNKALESAGLRLNVRVFIPDEELLESLKMLSKELGRPPRGKEARIASYSTYRKRFGTWDKALSKAGIQKQNIRSLKPFMKK